MATLKYCLNRKNASGTYDTIHYETSSNIVMRPSGRSVEQDLADFLPRSQNTDDVPQSLNIGNIVASPNHIWAGLNGVTELAKMSDLPKTPSVIDNLLSSSTADALSANQGRILNNAIKSSKFTTTTVFNGQFSGNTNIGNNTIFKLFSFNLDIVSGGGQYSFISITFSNKLLDCGTANDNTVTCHIRFPFIGLVMNLNEMYGICSAYHTDRDGSVIFSKSPSYITSVSCGGGDDVVASGTIIGYNF